VCLSPRNSRLEQWYPREMVIMVEGVHKIGEEVINEAMEVEEMVMVVEVGVTRN